MGDQLNPSKFWLGLLYHHFSNGKIKIRADLGSRGKAAAAVKVGREWSHQTTSGNAVVERHSSTSILTAALQFHGRRWRFSAPHWCAFHLVMGLTRFLPLFKKAISEVKESKARSLRVWLWSSIFLCGVRLISSAFLWGILKLLGSLDIRGIFSKFGVLCRLFFLINVLKKDLF